VGQLASLRAMPGLVTIRPADAGEVVEAWRVAMARRQGPVALVLTRQKVPVLDRDRYAPASGLARGAYVLAEAPGGHPELLLLATGSEVHLVLAAREALAGRGVRARVVSMPSWELFEQQPPGYRESVLPRAVRARLAVEQACTLGWDRYVGPDGSVLGMHGFGASAPGPAVEKRFGFTPEAIVTAATALLPGRGEPT
jgi:transketolase